MALRFAMLLPLALALLVLITGGAAAYTRASVQDKPGTYLFWKSRDISYKINPSGAGVPLAEAVGAVKRAFFTWASPSCTDVYFSFAGLTSTTSSNLTLGSGTSPDLDNVIVWHANWPPAGVNDGSVTADMVSLTTLIYIADTGEIADADIDLNGNSKFWTTSDDRTKVVYDIQDVMTFEVGHLLGLGNSGHPDATMYPDLKEGDLKKRDLHQDDIDGLCFIYPFEGATPTGAGQSIPPPQITGAPGCSLGAASARGSAGVVVLFLWLLATLATRRRRLRLSAERR